MPPRRHVALMLPLIALLWFTATQQNLLLLPRVLAQSVPASASQLAAFSPNDLPIDLVATNNSPQMVGFAVTLTATVASGNSAGLTYSWNFGDGQTAQGRVVQHAYSQPGTYSAFVIATNGTDSKRATTMVTVWPYSTPVPEEKAIQGLKATSDSPVIAGNPVSLLATVVEGTNVSYSWSFGDGQTATGPSVSHVYSIPGKYLITLRAVNPLGTASTSIQVDILDAPPKGLRIMHTNPLAINSAAAFTATVESGTNVQYQWSISDGTIFYGPRFVYLFTQTGTYEVRVRANNSAGEIFASEIVTVQDQAPTIEIIFDNSPKAINQPISFFTQIQSKSPVVVEWWWGDGQVTETKSRTNQDTMLLKEINATHEYTKKGRYVVKLLVKNQGGTFYHESIAYVDTTKSSPSIALSWQPTMPAFGRAVTFSVPLDNTHTCTWEFGDGDPLTEQLPTVSHTFTRAGSYVVHVQCDTVGNTATYSTDEIVHVGSTLFMPVLAINAAFESSQPTGSNGNVTLEPTVEPTATVTATPTATTTMPPPAVFVPTNTPTATMTEMPTEMPTVIPTDPFAPGGTIPQATPTPTDVIGPGGTIPQTAAP